MIRGILSATTAMRAQLVNQEVIANNLSNADTVAYQKDKATFSSFHDVLMYRVESFTRPALVGGLGNGTVLQDIVTSVEQGPLRNTDNPMDIALPKGAYLACETPSGTMYTRMGDLRVRDGYLTVAGYKVLGENGPIEVDDYTVCTISEDATVHCDGNEVGRLAMYSFPVGTVLTKVGNSLFRQDQGAADAIETPTVTVGALEGSTVDPVSEMVSMISSLRSYEAAQKVLQAQDETLDQAINRVGRV